MAGHEHLVPGFGKPLVVFWPSLYGPRFTAAATLKQGPWGDALIEQGDQTEAFRAADPGVIQVGLPTTQGLH